MRILALGFVWIIGGMPLAADAPRIRVGAGDPGHCGRMIRYVRPVYPKEARRKRIQGVVKFQAHIDTKGAPYNFQLLEGNPTLVPAALAAAKQWRYNPCLLNTEPVEVITTLDVSFTLNQ